MNQYVHYFEKAKTYEEYYSIISKAISSKYSLYKNNNDTFKIFISTFSKLKLFTLSFWDCFISYISSMRHFLYKLQFILLLQVFLFSFIATFEENANISTDLIISAYFPKNHITRISYDIIKEEENEKLEKNRKMNIKDNINNDDFPSSCNENVIFFDNNEMYNNKSKCYQKKADKKEINEDLLPENDDKRYSKIKNEFYNQIHNGNLISNRDHEVIFIYNITFRYLVINFLSFSLLYSFIKFTLNSKIRGSFIFNLFCVLISFNLLYALYRNEYYLSSNFFFILIIYINKNMIDSIYLKLNYKRKDFEIFSTSLMAFDSKQFHLKFIILVNITCVSGVLSIFFFKSFINYIVFYICLFTLMVFLSNCIEPIMPYYLKPIKNIIIFATGIINFLLSKFCMKFLILKSTMFIKQTNSILFKNFRYEYEYNFKNDSLYFISDLFSLFCFDYIRGYLEFQIEVNLLINNFIENNHEIKKSKMNKESMDRLGSWMFILWVSMIIGIVSIFKREYMCLIISIYLVNVLMNYFCHLYELRLCQYLNYLHTMVFLFTNMGISSNENTYLINLFFSFTYIDKDILLFFFKSITLMVIAYYIFVINLIIFNLNSDDFKNEKEIKKIRQDNQDSNIYHIEIVNVHFGFFQNLRKCIDIISNCSINYFIICILIIIYQDYETILFLKIIYALLAIVFHVIKILIINKTKNNFEYFFHSFVWFMFSIRLISLSNAQLSLIFFINHLNLLIFLIYYFLNEKRNSIFTILILLFLSIAYFNLNSYMLILDIIATIAIIIVINIINININEELEINTNKSKEEKDKEKNEDFGSTNVYNSLSLLFLLPIIVFFLLQLKFQNYFNLLNYVDKYIRDLMVKMYILYDKVEDKNNAIENEPLEFTIIYRIINGMKAFNGNP